MCVVKLLPIFFSLSLPPSLPLSLPPLSLSLSLSPYILNSSATSNFRPHRTIFTGRSPLRATLLPNRYQPKQAFSLDWSLSLFSYRAGLLPLPTEASPNSNLPWLGGLPQELTVSDTYRFSR